MARTRYINRTIVSTDVEVTVAHPDTKEFKSLVVTVNGTYATTEDEGLDKAVRKAFKDGKYDGVFVSIDAVTPVVKAYRMLEAEFIKLAECKVLSEGESVEEDEAGEDGEE